jgi:UDP-N-acetyl-2-amino-2-deoxyglucuronate dehydrogenase
MYTIGFIGCGKRARQHIEGVQADKRCKVVALADVKREAAESFNADYGFEAAVYDDYQRLLEEEQPDVIITCSRFATNGALLQVICSRDG